MGKRNDILSGIVFFDIETTGKSITKDRIVQIACVKDGVEKTMFLNPEMPISPEATEVHGITDEMVKDCPTFSQVSSSLFEYFGDHDLAGYNSNRFDIPIVIEEFGRVGIDFSLEGRKLYDVFQNECKRNPRTLEAVYERVTGEKMDGAHDASADTKATIAIFEDQIMTMKDEAFEQDEDRIDCSGKLKMIDGQICWAFGKWENKPVTVDLGYINWVLKGDFPKQVKDILRACL